MHCVRVLVITVAFYFLGIYRMREIQIYTAIITTLCFWILVFILLWTVANNIRLRRQWKRMEDTVYIWREQVLLWISDIKEQVQCSMHIHRLNQDDVVYRKWRDDKSYYNKSICKEIDSIIQELANNSWEIAEKTTDKLIKRRDVIKDSIEPLPRDKSSTS